MEDMGVHYITSSPITINQNGLAEKTCSACQKFVSQSQGSMPDSIQNLQAIQPTSHTTYLQVKEVKLELKPLPLNAYKNIQSNSLLKQISA